MSPPANVYVDKPRMGAIHFKMYIIDNVKMLSS